MLVKNYFGCIYIKVRTYLHIYKLVLEVENAMVGLQCLPHLTYICTHLKHNIILLKSYECVSCNIL